MLDVGHFKRFNDTHGHAAGDLVLARVGDVLTRCLREGDLAFRHGGEEFVAVLSTADAADAMACGERIRASISAEVLELHGVPLPRITLSVGVSTRSEQCGSVAQLMHSADAALYRAKNEGRNCVREMRLAA